MVANTHIDFHVTAGSVPRQFRRSADAFPRHNGYLRPDPGRVQYWRQRLAELGPGPKVGISWRGGMPSTSRGLRSIDLPVWAPLLRSPSIHFVSLQYGDTASELDRLLCDDGIPVHSWREPIDDLDETAALVCALDLVVSVCTAVIHLSGALGRPVWILVPSSAEWRYGAAGEAMPWYPSARLFRQRTAGQWEPVLHDVERALRGWVRDVE